MSSPMDKNEEGIEVEVMTAEEVASYLKVSVGAVRRWTREGKLRGYRLGGRGNWRYARADLTQFLYGEK